MRLHGTMIAAGQGAVSHQRGDVVFAKKRRLFLPLD